MYSLDEVKLVDPEIAQAITDEQARQNSHIELIASENWVSKAVMAAMGSPLTNKYAEGYPGKRYYGGCDCVDVVENLAIERKEAVWMRLCKCTASLRCTGEHGGAVRSVQSRRYHHGYESGTWRTSDTWFTCEYVR